MNTVNAIKNYTANATPQLPTSNVKPPMKDDPKVREAFDNFVGQTFFGQMLASMRKTQSKDPYFNGGRGEQVFRGQLDQQLAENMAKADGKQFSGPMFDLFALQRS